MIKIKRLDIALTTLCNFTCKYCRGNPGERKKIPFEEVRIILENFSEYALEAIRLDGGEPFIYGNEIFSIIEYAARKGMTTGIFTNASLLDRQIVKRLQEYIGLQLFVTLHTINEKNEFEATLNGLYLLAEYKILPELIIVVSKKHIPTIRPIIHSLLIL
ncbi:MAG TPA: radical SAM protein [Methylomusa anaerophila]|uniref:Molybdenum cofactor biosynthesis protein A n=1 Tax=Methylomusa anaerophila TaxID=1930071 RepID=A0A348AEK7_9FIRM|nr:radical SAM protein [Methylomusa anaerophila]BBB89505.1 molybdenum cofactor biosynthesis protein A [Methylomusa anaerophila]HML90125.1 radical SAM protein [Methylomusa anaerophila]